MVFYIIETVDLHMICERAFASVHPCLKAGAIAINPIRAKEPTMSRILPLFRPNSRHLARPIGAAAGAALLALSLGGCGMSMPSLGGSGGSAAMVEAPAITFADAADLVLISPIIVDVTVGKTSTIKAEDAPGLRPDSARILVNATVNTLLRGSGGVPGEVQFLIDLPRDAKGKAPKIKGQRMFVFARPVTGRPALVQPVLPDSAIGFSAANDALIRKATREAVAINAPPVITGVGQAFHFPGTIAGEGETQIFLDTQGGLPISINVVSRSGAQPLWNVSLGEVVDTQARAPERDSLLWYRLACGALPARLPVDSLASKSQAANVKADADYQYVRQALGACNRTRRLR